MPPCGFGKRYIRNTALIKVVISAGVKVRNGNKLCQPQGEGRAGAKCTEHHRAQRALHFSFRLHRNHIKQM